MYLLQTVVILLNCTLRLVALTFAITFEIELSTYGIVFPRVIVILTLSNISSRFQLRTNSHSIIILTAFNYKSVINVKSIATFYSALKYISVNQCIASTYKGFYPWCRRLLSQCVVYCLLVVK